VKKTVVLNLVVFCVVNFEKSRFETIFAVFVILQLQEVETQLSTTRCRRRQQAVDIMEICGHFIRSKVSDVSYVNKQMHALRCVSSCYRLNFRTQLSRKYWLTKKRRKKKEEEWGRGVIFR